MDFINKIFSKQIDESVHEQFVRFGKGIFDGRAAIKLQRGKDIRVSSGFEYSKDFAETIAEMADRFSVSGTIVSREQIIELGTAKMKRGIFTYVISKEMSSKELKEILKKCKYALLNISASGIMLKCKQKLPKPGKSKEKIDDKFCILNTELKYWSQIKKMFFSDISDDVKKVSAKHTIEVKNIKVPEGVTDFEQMRLMAKREGKITRFLEIDKKETKGECEFSA